MLDYVTEVNGWVYFDARRSELMRYAGDIHPSYDGLYNLEQLNDVSG